MWIVLWVATLTVYGLLEGLVLTPRRRKRLEQHLAQYYPEMVSSIILFGSDTGREDAPSFEHLVAASSAGVVRCAFRHYSGTLSSVREGWDDVGPITADEWSRDRLSVWVSGTQVTGDLPRFLAVVAAHCDDPSRLTDAARLAVDGESLSHVLHGTAGKRSSSLSPAEPALLALTSDGVVAVRRPMSPRYPEDEFVPAPQAPKTALIGWHEQPTVAVVPGLLPSVRVTWNAGEFTLRCCLLGSVEVFAHRLRVQAPLSR